MYTVFKINKIAVYSVYYDGVESTAQYSLLNTHEVLNRILFYSYSSSFLDKYFYSTHTSFFWKVMLLLLEDVFSVLFLPLDNPQRER